MTSIPIVPAGMASCLACVGANLRGGNNSCGLKPLRDHPDERRSRMARSERGEFFECGVFQPLKARMRDHRLGLVNGKLPDEQESLF